MGNGRPQKTVPEVTAPPSGPRVTLPQKLKPVPEEKADEADPASSPAAGGAPSPKSLHKSTTTPVVPPPVRAPMSRSPTETTVGSLNSTLSQTINLPNTPTYFKKAGTPTTSSTDTNDCMSIAQSMGLSHSFSTFTSILPKNTNSSVKSIADAS